MAKKRDTYDVIVGNIGTVYSGHAKQTALRHYRCYVKLSIDNDGRVAGENVTLMRNDEPWMEYIGTLAAEEDM